MKPVEAIRKAMEDSGVGYLLIGISGGADSVALLRGAIDAGAKISAVHCNFHLRGVESDRDCRMVRELCASLGVPLTVMDFNVTEYMREHRVSVEMACRELRYREFEKLRETIGADRIAVAHNADDNAETLLMNLMRGSGVSGLRAMREDTGTILRPLLHTSRQEIEEYLEEIGQTFVTDSTNLESDYRRNFIRNEVMPLLTTRWPAARVALNRTSHIMESEERMLEWAEQQFIGKESVQLPYQTIKNCPDRLWLIRRFISRFGGNNAQAREIAKALASSDFQSGKKWIVKDGRITFERDALEFISDRKDVTDCKDNIVCERVNVSPELISIIKRSPLTELWTSISPEQITFRHPAAGDRIKPLGMQGSMLVSKIMKDAGYSTSDKENCLVAVDNETGEIIWVAGLKRSRHYLVAPGPEYCYHYSSTFGRG